MTKTTGAAARILGMHPNTLRWYETAGYLPPVPRTSSGYRRYSPEHVRLARIVRRSQPLLRVYGPIRRTTFLFLAACRERCVAAHACDCAHAPSIADAHRAARERLDALVALLREEYRLSLEALAALERYRKGSQDTRALSSRPAPLQYIAAAARQTGLSRDQIINWERDGLARYPRSAGGYRLFGRREVDRLLIIRSCRTAGYSITAIRRLLQSGKDAALRDVADTPTPQERAFFPVFPTDTLPATLQGFIALTEELRTICDSPD